MPGTNAGTGQPSYFNCTMCRRHPCRQLKRLGTGLVVQMCDHKQYRTGRTKPYKGGNRGPRGLMEHHEYVCDCGHRGWSRLSMVLRIPIQDENSS